MKTSFSDLGISPPILKAIEEMGFEAPTEVQIKAIPHILNKEDLIVKSKTGSGKTAVFGVSMLQMTDPGALEPQGLILTPTRELAVQIDSDIKQMSKYLQHKTAAVYGQHSMNIEIQALNRGVSIVTGTPGRVFDHIRHGNLKTKQVRFLVLDEADRMLDMGFLDQVVKIIKTLPKDRVTLLFSATIPAEMRKICREYMKHPVTIEIESQTMTVDTTEQVYYRVERNEKNTQLNHLLLVEQPESCIIFCNTRITVDRVQTILSRMGYASESLHGDIPQSRRLKTIQQFKQGEFHILVATDVAARGIHIDALSLVINYDVPIEKDSYVHRIGRTGRAGNVGRAITLVTGDDIMSLYEIEEHIGAMIVEGELPTEAVFNEHRAAAEKWIQANSLKVKSPRALTESSIKNFPKKLPQTKSPRATSESNFKEVRKKVPQTKSHRNYDKHDNRPIEQVYSSEHKTAKIIRPVHPSEQAEPVLTTVKPIVHHSTDTKVSQSKVIHSKVVKTKVAQTKVAQTNAAQTNKPQPNEAQNKGTTVIVQNQASATKKPFLQRVLQSMLGK
ncbi:MAG: DEAD/DEAH box helicase [Ruminiclostridium sp.]